MNIGSTQFIHFTFAYAICFSAVTHADVAYVWSGDGTIMRFDTNGLGSLVTSNDVSDANGPVGVALDNVGNLYAGVPSSSSIFRFSSDGTRAQVGFVDSVSGLAFDSGGTLYVTMPNWREIARPVWSNAYGLPFAGPYSGSHLSYPINLCFDDAGDVYVANSVVPFGLIPSPYTNTIEKFSTNFTYLGAFATNLNNPWGLAFDKVPNLYVANSGTNGLLNNTIVKFTTNGVGSTFATASNGLSSPRGLAFDSAGNLYVANYGNGTIQKFTPEGVGSVFASGLNSPTSIAVFPGLNLWSAKPIELKNPKMQTVGAFQFDIVNNPGLSFKVLASTNVSLGLSNWATVGGMTEVSPGVYRFTEQATNNEGHFYRIFAP